MVLPWCIIWHLQVKKIEKIVLGFVLSLGLLYVSFLDKNIGHALVLIVVLMRR